MCLCRIQGHKNWNCLPFKSRIGTVLTSPHYVYIGTKADGKKPESKPPRPEPGQL